MSNIGVLIQTYQDKHGTSDRGLALRIGVSPTLIGKWKRGDFVELPGRERIDALADQIAVDYDVLLEAFLLDVGYRSEESDGDDRNAAPTSKRSSERRETEHDAAERLKQQASLRRQAARRRQVPKQAQPEAEEA